jgi:hypothetical protein
VGRLREHACLGYAYLASDETWRFTILKARKKPLKAGLGIALQLDFLVWDAVREGRLVPRFTTGLRPSWRCT